MILLAQLRDRGQSYLFHWALRGSKPIRFCEHEPRLEFQVQHGVKEPSQEQVQCNVDAVPFPLFEQWEVTVITSVLPSKSILVIACIRSQVIETLGKHCEWEEQREDYLPRIVLRVVAINQTSCYLNNGTEQENDEAKWCCQMLEHKHD